jgi:16S rRNA (uracil1498-N3)-methyltransferase
LRLFIPPKDILTRTGIVLSAERSHYLLNVLRVAKGDRFTAIDGRGGAYLARITDIVRQVSSAETPRPVGSGMRAVVEILEDAQTSPESPVNLVLCQGLLKGDKMDLVVQKATELGVSGIQPLVTERSVVRHTRKVPRWTKIAEEAAEQCGRTTVPPVHEPRELSSFLAERSPLAGIILWEEGGLPLSEAMDRLILSRHSPPLPGTNGLSADLVLIVGPEGGLSAPEVAEAQSRGFVPVTLGSRTLRAETAAIVGIALSQFILEHGRP